MSRNEARNSATRTFRQLSEAVMVDPGTIRAREIEETPCLVGIDENGMATLLVRTTPSDVAESPIVMKRIDAHFGMPCELILGDRRENALLTRIRCLDSDPRTVQHFLAVCDSLVDLFGSSPVAQDVRSSIMRLATMFLSLDDPPRESWVGIIGELVYIHSREDVDTAIEGWHKVSTDRMDFVSETFKLDVKSTSSRIRKHTLSYDQVIQRGTVPVYFASIFVELTDTGTSVRNLIDGILARSLNGGNQLKLLNGVTQALGAETVRYSEVHFDMDLATNSVEYYEATAVPGVRGALPPGVSGLRFESDFSLCEPIGENVSPLPN